MTIAQGLRLLQSGENMVKMEGFGVGDDGAQRIAAVLRDSGTVRALYLSKNAIGPRGARALAEALKSNRSLKELLVSNNAVGPQGADSFSKALRSNTTLTGLCLWNNAVGPAGAKALAGALLSNRTLKWLSLYNDGLGIVGLRPICDALTKNTTLAWIDVGDNGLGDQGAALVAGMLQVNVGLNELRIAQNGITATGATAIGDALESNSSLITLRLSGNPTGPRATGYCNAMIRINADGSDIPKAFVREVPGEVFTRGVEAVLATARRLAAESAAREEALAAARIAELHEQAKNAQSNAHAPAPSPAQQQQRNSGAPPAKPAAAATAEAAGIPAELLLHCKLMLLGQGTVGKTTLLHRLRSGSFGTPRMTDGVDVSPWLVRLPDGRALQMSSWDFGGQTEYYTTHAAFLSLRCVYLVVWNANHRDEARDPDGEHGIRFWLHSLSVYTPGATVLIVGTHATLGKTRPLPLTAEEYRRAFPKLDIAGFIPVDSEDGYGVESLQQAIVDAALRQDGVADRVPNAWEVLRARVAEERGRINPPLVSVNMARTWASMCGIGNEHEQDAALGYLHDTGALLWYGGRKEGAGGASWTGDGGRVILDPTWLPRVMACFVTADPIKGRAYSEGILLERTLFLALWHEYPASVREDLLSIMQRFEIVFALDDERLFVPAMLPLARPSSVADAQRLVGGEGSVSVARRVYECRFLPAAFFPKLLFRCYRFVREASEFCSGAPPCWRRGAVLRKNGHVMMVELRRLGQGSEALVRIELTCRGPAPANFVSIASDTLETLIAEEFHGVDLDVLAACPRCLEAGSGEVGLFREEKLKRLRERGREQTECPQCLAEIDVDELENALARDTDTEEPASGAGEGESGARMKTYAPQHLASLEREVERLRTAMDKLGTASAPDSTSTVRQRGGSVITMNRSQLSAALRETMEEVMRVQDAKLRSELEKSMRFTAQLFDKSIPTAICILPEAGRSLDIRDWGRNVYRMFLLCECGGCGGREECSHGELHHFADHAGYKIRDPRAFLRCAAPVLKRSLQLLLSASSIVGIHVPGAVHKVVGNFFDSDQNIRDLLDHVASNAESIIAEDFAGGDLKRRQLQDLLEKKDKNHEWAGLVQIKDMQDGRVLWVCPECAAKRDLEAQRIST